MGTVAFDVDSTLINCESLELLLKSKLNPEQAKAFQEITISGLRGLITFPESLNQRLKIAQPNLQETIDFGRNLISRITPGMKELIEELKENGHDVWIVSGGLKESLVPLCRYLNIPEEQLIAVQLLWSDKGEFLQLDPHDPNTISKAKGAASFVKMWQSPKVMIGDAWSDWRLLEEKLVDRFILYTEHFRCPELVAKGLEEASSVKQLRRMIFDDPLFSKRQA